MENRIFHCFFEQSGTFKNEFKKLGYLAYDYDILNDFNETDYVVDLFKEIEKGYGNLPSIFDNISKNDMILAFFPCVRFEHQIRMHFKGVSWQHKKFTDEQKLQNDLILHKELSNLYELVTKLAIICLNKKIPLIIENPYTTTHYLSQYWAIKPKIIDNDRTLNGDYFKKPTQYWFINCDPKNNFIFEPLEYVKTKKVNAPSGKGWQNDCAKERSMIHPQYANRFIRQYILDEKEVK